MNPIHPWLDPAEVRRLAENLLAPPIPTLPPPAADPGFHPQFVGFVAAPAEPPATAGPPAVEAPPPPEPPPPQVASPAAETDTPAASPARASGPFLERIQRFRDWLGHHFSATGVFLLDHSGAVIFDDSGHGRFHFLARGLALNSRRPGSSSGNIQLKIGAAATLEVIPVETPYGSLVLGAVVPAPLPPATVVIVSDALSEVAAPLRRKPD